MDHGDMDMDMGGMSMSMSFHFGVSETILFDFWKTSDVGGLLGSIVLVFFMGVAYEGLKYLREFLMQSHKRRISVYTVFPTQAQGQEEVTPPARPVQLSVDIFSGIHFVQTGLHFVQFVLSYLLMLIFMTYNVWLCLGVAFGATVGYFFFGWQRQSVQDNNEHCH